MRIHGLSSIRLNNSLSVSNKTRTNNNITQPLVSDTFSVSFASKSKLLSKDIYSELETLHEQTLNLLIKAEQDAKSFESNGQKFGNISNHIKIKSPVMQNKDGKDCWLEFSSSKQYLSYGENGPLRIKVEGEKQGITAATLLNNGDIDYITVTPTQGYKGNNFFDFSHTKAGSCGSGCWSLGKEDSPVKFGSEMEQVELFKDTVTGFIDLMKSST